MASEMSPPARRVPPADRHMKNEYIVVPHPGPGVPGDPVEDGAAAEDLDRKSRLFQYFPAAALLEGLPQLERPARHAPLPLAGRAASADHQNL